MIGGTNRGTLNGGAGFSTGVVGQAFSFNGVSSYVQVADSASLTLTNELTIEFWVKLQRTDGQADYIIEKGGDFTGGVQNYAVAIHQSSLVFLCGGSGRYAGQITDLNWHHCAVVARNQQPDPVLYIDGVQQSILHREGGPTMNLYPSTRPLHIGAQIDPLTGWSYFSKTLLDELAIYNRALSEAEIQGIYLAGSAGKCDNHCVPHGATASATVVNGFVVGVNITDRGCGYTNPPLVRIIGAGTGATATASISNGIVTAINITDAGSGYTNNPSVLVGSPPFLPWLEIAVSKVKVTLHVVLGANYILEASSDLAHWSQVGPQFTAQSELIAQEFDVDTTGRFFRIRQVP